MGKNFAFGCSPSEQCQMVVFVADDFGFFGARDSGPRDRALCAPRHSLDA